MTEDEAYKVHIQYTFNAFCKIVIRHAAIDIILKLRRRWEREVSLDYLNNSAGRQHSLLSPLDCLPAKTGGTVNGGAYAPFILTVDWLGWLCYFIISFNYCQRKYR